MSDPTSRPWWRWRTGMRTACGLRVYVVDTYGQALGVRENDRRARPEVCALPHDAQPAPDDPGTLGCLTQRARDLHNDPKLHVTPHPIRGLWYAYDRHGRVIATGPTEFAALLAACDAAPGGGA